MQTMGIDKTSAVASLRRALPAAPTDAELKQLGEALAWLNEQPAEALEQWSILPTDPDAVIVSYIVATMKSEPACCSALKPAR